jgi:hypothetical protein
LELFGRPARATGFASERSNTPTPAQKLHLLNSSHVRSKLESRFEAARDTSSRRRGGSARRARGSPKTSPPSASLSPETATEVYLAVLSRFPTRDELAVVDQYAESAEAEGAEVLIDLTWALINTPEFLYRH